MTKNRMTRKDYEFIARVLKDQRESDATVAAEHDAVIVNLTLDVIAQSFALELTKTDPNFDRARFLTACGVQS